MASLEEILRAAAEEKQSKPTVSDFIVAIGLLFLFPYIAMLIWNWQVAPNFGIAEMTYWQSFFIGIMMKCWCPKPKTGK